MERTLFSKLLQEFVACCDINSKVELLLKYDLKTLTNTQIEKILNELDEASTKKFVAAISKKLEAE